MNIIRDWNWIGWIKLLFFADDGNLLCGNTNATQKKRASLDATDTSKEDSLEIKIKRKKFILLFLHHDVG
jgi:hypothetical protein